MQSLQGEERPAGRRAFTFVELLAVFVCIALLVGIIQPSLQAALGKSRLVTCLDRLQRIGQASLTYSAEDHGFAAIPVHPYQFAQDPDDPTFIGAYEWGGKSGVGDNGFVPQYAGHPLGSRYGTAAAFGPANRPLNRILYPHGFSQNFDLETGRVVWRAGAENDTRLELEAFHCPADDGPPKGAHCPDWIENPRLTSYDYFGTSYAANTFWIGQGAYGMHSNSPYLRPVTGVPNPARTITYEENIGRWAWASRNEIDECLWLGLGIDPGPTKSLRAWHGKDWTYTRAFVDSHAEYQPVYIAGTEDPDGYAQHYRSEVVFPDDPELQNRYYCTIIRGDGWQKDTLPAEPIATGLHSTGGRASHENCIRNK